MNAFHVKDHCMGCGACARDCITETLVMRDGRPVMTDEKRCMRCLHCVSVCPEGAIAIRGFDPADGLPADRRKLAGFSALKRLAGARRSVRSYKRKDVPAGMLQDVLSAADNAPTGVNVRRLWIGLVDSLKVMDAFREAAYARLLQVAESDTRPESPRLNFLIQSAQAWKEKGADAVFRGAPHCLIVGNRNDAPCRDQDPLIYLSYFELLARARGIGTCWCGLLYWTLDLLPDLLKHFGFPDDHTLGYCMLLGMPDVTYPRYLDHEPMPVRRLTW